jgi:hypothetical protein
MSGFKSKLKTMAYFIVFLAVFVLGTVISFFYSTILNLYNPYVECYLLFILYFLIIYFSVKKKDTALRFLFVVFLIFSIFVPIYYDDHGFGFGYQFGSIWRGIKEVGFIYGTVISAITLLGLVLVEISVKSMTKLFRIQD